MLAVRDATCDARTHARAHNTCDYAHDYGACLCVILDGTLIMRLRIVMMPVVVITLQRLFHLDFSPITIDPCSCMW